MIIKQIRIHTCVNFLSSFIIIFYFNSDIRKSIKLHSFAHLASTDTKDIDTFFYKQTLDHFNYRPESYNTFDQRYLINFKYWGGANYSAPIFVYLGAEDAIDPSPYSVGFMIDNAPTCKALLVYIEV